MTNPLHIGQWGVCITTPQVTKEKATVNVVTTVENGRDERTDLTLRIKLRDPTGKTIQTGETKTEVAAGGHVEIPMELEVTSPPLWSIDSPHLCHAEVELLVDGKAVDTTTTTFGIREIKFSVENGFTLNGVSVKLRGACLHHDNGPLGSTAFDRAEERRVEVLKAGGIDISMSGKGRAFDNILVERLWQTVKYEEVYLKEYCDGHDLIKSLRKYFDYYNERRPHGSLDYRTPAEAYQQGRDSLCVASVTPSLRKAKELCRSLQLTPFTEEKMVLTRGRG